MAIDKLGSAAGILAILRAEMSQRGERARQRPTKQADLLAPAGKRRGDVQVLRAQLAEIVKSVDARDGEAVRQARPQVVRAILLWEFGPEFREHPDWQPILESIVRTLEAQPSHDVQFRKLVDSLKR
jgi:hypothetical protein